MTHNSKLALEIMANSLEGKDVIYIDPKSESRITTKYVDEAFTLRSIEEYDGMVYSIVSDDLITKEQLFEEMVQMQMRKKQASMVVMGENGERLNALSFTLTSAERAVKLEKGKSIQTNQLKIYFRVIDGARDAEGNETPAGLVLDFGEANREFEYSEIIEKFNIKSFIEAYGLEFLVKHTQLEIITPDEYCREFESEG